MRFCHRCCCAGGWWIPLFTQFNDSKKKMIFEEKKNMNEWYESDRERMEDLQSIVATVETHTP